MGLYSGIVMYFRVGGFWGISVFLFVRGDKKVYIIGVVCGG